MRLLAVLLPCIVVATCGGPGEVVAAAPREGETGTLVVRVEGFEDAEGQALVALFLGPEGFPNENDKAFRAVEAPIADGSVELVFEDVPAGPFAISAFHDRDLDYELDTGLFGIPSERWGVSRDAGGFLGPPSYDSAVLQLAADQRLEVRVPLG